MNTVFSFSLNLLCTDKKRKDSRVTVNPPFSKQIQTYNYELPLSACSLGNASAFYHNRHVLYFPELFRVDNLQYRLVLTVFHELVT